MTIRCCVCGSEDLDVHRECLRDGCGDERVQTCRACGLVQVQPRPTAAEEKDFYSANMQDLGRDKEIDYVKLRANQTADTVRHADLAETLTPDRGARVLDVGSGYGFYLREMADRGYTDLLGVEIGASRRALAMEHAPAIRMIDADVTACGDDIGTFDLVTCFHVLEHTVDPVAVLRSLGCLVSPGGTLLVEVPNVRELMAEAVPAYDRFYWIRAHLQYFDAGTLRDCFARAGLEVEIRHAQRYGLANLAHWLTMAQPQIDAPDFGAPEGYEWLDEAYRARLVADGRSDTLVAVVAAEGEGLA